MDTLNTFNDALKELYRGQKVHNLVYKGNAFLGIVPKFNGFVGRNMPLPIIFGTPQSRSATFTDAQNNNAHMLVDQFTLTRVSNYGIGVISGELLDAADGNLGSFLKSSSAIIDGVFLSVSRSLSNNLYRTSEGSLGAVAKQPGNVDPAPTDTTIVLTDANDVQNFEVGMEVQLIDGTSGDLQDAGASSVITAIDRTGGVLTISCAPFVSITENDRIVPIGDFQNMASGLAEWIPVAAPDATPFFGVNRRQDTIRLGGCRYNGSADTIDTAVINLSGIIAQNGGSPDVLLISYPNWRALQDTLGAQVRYVQVPARGVKGEELAKIGFQALEIMGAKGVIKVLPDDSCPVGLGYMLQLDTWVLATLGECPRILTRNNNDTLTVYNADSVEVRVGYYGQLGCSAPGYNGVVQLPAL
jgi:hypothetical protein